jgi:hypothetical protein
VVGGTVVVGASVVLEWLEGEVDVVDVILVDGRPAVTFAAAAGDVVSAAFEEEVDVEEDEVFARTAALTASAARSRQRMRGTDRADFRVAAPTRAMRQLSPLRGLGIPSPPLGVQLSRQNGVFRPQAYPD